MPLVRIHVSLFAGDPENHERTITFLQVSELLPDDVDLAEFAQGLQARVLIEQETDFRSGEQGNGPRAVVDLTPDRTPF